MHGEREVQAERRGASRSDEFSCADGSFVRAVKNRQLVKATMERVSEKVADDLISVCV